MKKITWILLFLLLTIPMYADRYLVQTGIAGDPFWEYSNQGTIVDLDEKRVTLNDWIATRTHGDEVWLCQGRYNLGATLDLNKSGLALFGGFNGKEDRISDRQKSDMDGNGMIEPWEFTHATIISGNGAFRCVTIEGDVQTILDGATIQFGKSKTGGAGVYLAEGGSLTHSIIRDNTVDDCQENAGACGVQNIRGAIDGCLIENNVIDAGTFAGSGGGVGCTTYSALIKNSVVRSNEIRSIISTIGDNKGGGIYLKNGGVAQNCVVYNNSTVGNGGGIYLENVAEEPVSSVYYCTVTNNKAELQSGGIHTNASGEIMNTIVWNNISSQATNYNAFFYKEIADSPSNTQINFIAFNGGVNYSDGIIKPTHTVDLSSNTPIFIRPTTFQGVPDITEVPEVINADWQLTPTSALLNEATVLDDISTGLLGTIRPQGVAPDMGAYELPYFTLTSRIGDHGEATQAEGVEIVPAISLPRGIETDLIVKPNVGFRATITYNDLNITSSLVGENITLPALMGDSRLNILFTDISGLTEDVETWEILCYATSRGIGIKMNQDQTPVTIHNISGVTIYSNMITDRESFISLPLGIYIVHARNQVIEVVVK